MAEPPDPTDELLGALDVLAESIDRNLKRSQAIQSRIESIRRQSIAGVDLEEIVVNEDRPLIVTQLSDSIDELQRAGSQWRWVQANALRSAGMSVAEIARQFGVTRQRISALLRTPPKSIQNRPGT